MCIAHKFFDIRDVSGRVSGKDGKKLFLQQHDRLAIKAQMIDCHGQLRGFSVVMFDIAKPGQRTRCEIKNIMADFSGGVDFAHSDRHIGMHALDQLPVLFDKGGPEGIMAFDDGGNRIADRIETGSFGKGDACNDMVIGTCRLVTSCNPLAFDGGMGREGFEDRTCFGVMTFGIGRFTQQAEDFGLQVTGFGFQGIIKCTGRCIKTKIVPVGMQA